MLKGNDKRIFIYLYSDTVIIIAVINAKEQVWIIILKFI
jgi:hypothetical protein